MDTLKHTPLYDLHIAQGGKVIDFGGWALPVQYSSILAEHKAVRECAGLFDVSHMGEVVVHGNDAYDFLQKVLTNDIESMVPGRCRYSAMCYEDGGTVDDILVCMYAKDHYLLVVNASNSDKDFEWLKSHVFGDVKLENQSAAWGQLALQGPRFMEVLEAAKVGEVPAKYYTFVPESTVGGIPCMIARTGYTGETGVEIYSKAEDTAAIYRALMAAGEPIGMLPCGLGARDTLRFEASMPLYGHELTKDITPLECGINFAVKLEKSFFIGKESLQNPLKRVRIGLKLTDRGVAREHSDVYAGDKKVGFVTSGGVAPTLGGNYAMALIDIAHEGDAEFEIDVRGRKIGAQKVEMPFYKRSK